MARYDVIGVPSSMARWRPRGLVAGASTDAWLGPTVRWRTPPLSGQELGLGLGL
jgi:hypothetical protein